MQHTQDFIALCNAFREQVDEITLSKLQQLIADGVDFHLIDVRDPDEFIEGAMPNATHISKGWLEAKIGRVVSNKHDKIVLYCGSGNRSILAAANLKLMGYSDVLSLMGGYKGWLKSQSN